MKFTVIFKGSSFVVVDLKDSLPRNEHFPFGSVFWNGGFVKSTLDYQKIPDRRVDKVWVHHTAGGTTKGFAGPMATAGFCVQDPRVKDGAIVPYTGRSWPGIPYHLFISHKPEIHEEEKLPIIYSCWPKEWIIWGQKGHNRHGYSVVCQGKFNLKPGETGTKGHPSTLQFDLLQAAWDEYLKPLLRLTDKQLYGHCDATKPSCPGGTIYEWILGRREKRLLVPAEASE